MMVLGIRIWVTVRVSGPTNGIQVIARGEAVDV